MGLPTLVDWHQPDFSQLHAVTAPSLGARLLSFHRHNLPCVVDAVSKGGFYSVSFGDYFFLFAVVTLSFCVVAQPARVLVVRSCSFSLIKATVFGSSPL